MQLLITLAIYVALYALMSYSFQKMAQKLNIEDAWLVWIPIVNIFIFMKMAGKSYWWILLFFVPIVNLVAAIIVFMEIAKRLNKSSFWGILMLVPIVNFIAIPYVAFSKDDVTVTPQA